jgi:putative transposase
MAVARSHRTLYGIVKLSYLLCNSAMDLFRHYHRHRYPIEVVSRSVWLYFRYSLSYRDVEEMMLERGVTVSYETIRAWCQKFSAKYSKRLKKWRGLVGDTWHLDEVYLKIDGRNQYLWRAVDQDGEVIDILVQSHRDSRAAERFFRKILRVEGALSRRVITDWRGSYGVAMKKLMPCVEHTKDKGLSNRAENSHQPTRQRERRRHRFRSAGSAQRFLSSFSTINNHFRNSRHTLSASNHRLVLTKRFAEWNQICGSVA